MLGKRIRVEKWKEGREESEKGESVRGRERRGRWREGESDRGDKDEGKEWKAPEEVERKGKRGERREL